MAGTDFSVLLKAELDSSGINAELKQIQDLVSKYSIEIIPELKSASLKNQLKSVSQEIANDFNKAFGTNLTGNDIFKVFENQAKQAQKVISQSFNKLAKSYQAVQNLKVKQSSLDPSQDSAKYNELQNQIDSAKQSYDDLYKSTSQNSSFDASAWKKVQDAIESATESQIAYNNAKKQDTLNNNITSELNSLEQLKSKWQESGVYTDNFKQKVADLENALSNVSSKGDLTTYRESLESVTTEINQAIQAKKQLENIQYSIKVGDFDTQIKSYEISLEKLGLSADEIQKRMKDVKTAFDELKTSASGDDIIPDQVVSNAEKLEEEMDKLSNTVKQIKLNDSLQADDLKVNDTITKLNEQLQKNTAYSSGAKEQIHAWISELESGSVAESRLKQINTEAKALHATMRDMGKIGLSWPDKFKQGIESFSGWISATTIVMTGINNVKKMANEVLSIDSALTELRKVSDAPESEITKYFDQATESAKKYGAAIDDVISSTADWSRLGYSLKDSSILSDATTLLQTVGDNMTQESSSEGLISILKGFNYDAEEVNSIIDVINQVANTEPIDTAGIVDALQRSASSLYAAGNDLNQSVSMITAANSVVQDPESIGTSFKTKFSQNCLYVQKCAYKTHLIAGKV